MRSLSLVVRGRIEQTRASRAMRLFFKLLPAIAVLIGAATDAQAEMGPCKPDAADGLTCGSGIGAARVIEDTVSPDERFAFAWRDPEAAPDDTPEGYQQMEFLLVRIADGAVLAKDKTYYWQTGNGRANRVEEIAIWSPDSRIAVRRYDTRYETEALQAFVLAEDGKADMVELRKIVEPAVLKFMRAKPQTWFFSLATDAKSRLARDGTLRTTVMMWMRKEDARNYFAVSVQIARGGDGLAARVLRVRETDEPEPNR